MRSAADALAKLGDRERAKEQVRALESLCRSFPRIYDRHWVLFCADENRDLDAALELARKDLELRQDVFAYDTLAWVCFKKGLMSEAEQHMAKALSRGTQSALLYFHAGTIARGRGDSARARSYFEHARSLNEYLMKDVKVD
jgi:tetratricopeptide (TPR) repeat protein